MLVPGLRTPAEISGHMFEITRNKAQRDQARLDSSVRWTGPISAAENKQRRVLRDGDSDEGN